MEIFVLLRSQNIVSPPFCWHHLRAFTLSIWPTVEKSVFMHLVTFWSDEPYGHILKDWSHVLPLFFIISLIIQVIDWQILNLPPSNLCENHPISSINFITVQWYLLIIFPNIQPWLYISTSEIYQNQPCKLISSFKLTTLLLLIWNFNTFYTNDCCL